MRVHQSMDQLPDIPAPVVTMGSFDGVHAGHRVIIARLNMLAVRCGGESVLITFHPHPRKVLYPEGAGKDLQLITTLEEKCQLLEETGLDHLIVMEFTQEFSKTSSRDFVRDYLHKRLHAHTIVVGFNHFFGHNKEGSFASLYECRDRYGFQVEEIPEQEIQHETVSSTKIRKALREGHIQRANAHLEHHFLLMCIAGRAHGPDAGLPGPCFRLEVSQEDKLVPPPGLYAASYFAAEESAKALVRISADGLLLIPEKAAGEPGAGLCRIHFHKCLGPSDRDLVQGLQDVSSLIY